MCHQAHKLRKSERAKLRTCGGFSLSEIILTMFIILLATGIAVDGIPAVIRAYQRTVDVANAETYLNTVTIALRNRLSLAASPKTPDEDENKVAYYTDPKIGHCALSSSDSAGIQITEGAKWDEIGLEDAQPKPLALDGAEKFIASYDEIRYDEGTAFFTIKNLKVKKTYKNGVSEELASLDSDYIIHTLNPSP